MSVPLAISLPCKRSTDMYKYRANMHIYANTCPLELELPGQVTTYDDFKRNMNSAIDMQEGFGIV